MTVQGQKHSRRRLVEGVFPLLLLCLAGIIATLGTPCPAAEYEWEISSVAPTKAFYSMSDRSLRLDSQGYPHLAYGGDHLYYARYDGTRWHIETVDDFPGVGRCASLALDSTGRPHIAYWAGHDVGIKYAYHDGSAWNIETAICSSSHHLCWGSSLSLSDTDRPHLSFYGEGGVWHADRYDSQWHAENIDSGRSVEKYTSLALDSTGNPHFAYYNGYVIYAVWDGSTWQCEAPEYELGGREACSLYLDENDWPCLCYHAYWSGDLAYAEWAGTAWSVEQVDSTGVGTFGQTSSITKDATGTPYIAYFHEANKALKLAFKRNESWQIEIVDDVGCVGAYPSVAADELGDLHVSYHAYGELRHAVWNGADWVIQTVEGGADRGSYSSVALDAYGWPCVAYYNGSTATLEFVYRDRNRWSVETVDDGRDVGKHASLKMDGLGRSHICYYDAGNSALRLARKDGPDWIITTIDSEGDVGKYCSLDIDQADHPHISYHDQSINALKVARFDGAAWIIETVENYGGGGRHSSIAVDENHNVHVSFCGWGRPMYAYNGEDGWQTNVLDYHFDYPWSTAITAAPSGQPHVAFNGRNSTSGTYGLRYAVRETTGWKIATVDTGGSDISLALDQEGRPHITYHWENCLRHAYLLNNTWRIEIVEAGAGSDAGVGWYSSIIIDPSGHPLISYYDQGLLDLKIAYAPTVGGSDSRSIFADRLRLEISGSSPCQDVARMILQIPSKQEVDVSVFDVLGRRVRTLRQGTLSMGSHMLLWDGKDPFGKAVPSGTYICSALSEQARSCVRIVLLK